MTETIVWALNQIFTKAFWYFVGCSFLEILIDLKFIKQLLIGQRNERKLSGANETEMQTFMNLLYLAYESAIAVDNYDNYEDTNLKKFNELCLKESISTFRLLVFCQNASPELLKSMCKNISMETKKSEEFKNDATGIV
jgi:hypothetical protein